VKRDIAIYAALGFFIIEVVQPAAALEEVQCLAGELPIDAIPLAFVRPHVPLECWRAEREGDGRGISFSVHFDVSLEGRTENIDVRRIDPICAKPHIEEMVGEWRFPCSEEGRKKMRISMTISSSVN